jgi:hypothetical protein
MRGYSRQYDGWEDEADFGEASNAYAYNDDEYDDALGQMDYGAYDAQDDEERGLLFQPDHSLVNVSRTVTHHGVPLLSYTRTMNRFYTTRKQRLSLGRFKCQVCGERIRFWAWQTNGNYHTHDGCYERLAWTWTTLYAQQSHLSSQGQFE